MPRSTKLPKPPDAFRSFVERFPHLGEAWNLTRAEGGALDERTRRLVKLAIAVGALREGAVHSATRKARAFGLPDRELEEVVALAASTIGFPAAVAAFTWLRDEAPPARSARSSRRRKA